MSSSLVVSSKGMECPWTYGSSLRNNRKGGTASLRSRTCVKRNAVFGARFQGISLYFLYQKGNLIHIKTGLDTYLRRIQIRTPLSRYPPFDYSPFVNSYLPITYFCWINWWKVTDTVTDSLLLWINRSYRCRWARQCPFPLPRRIAQKLPVRNSWELVIKKLPIPLPIFIILN